MTLNLGNIAMTLHIIDSFIEEFEVRLGSRSFITIRELVDYGIYGSMSSARMALTNGRLPFVKISPRRFAIPRQALLLFLCENFNKNHSLGVSIKNDD